MVVDRVQQNMWNVFHMQCTTVTCFCYDKYELWYEKSGLRYKNVGFFGAVFKESHRVFFCLEKQLRQEGWCVKCVACLLWKGRCVRPGIYLCA